eukprot:5043900-Amphidinium_carterae.1
MGARSYVHLLDIVCQKSRIDFAVLFCYALCPNFHTGTTMTFVALRELANSAGARMQEASVEERKVASSAMHEANLRISEFDLQSAAKYPALPCLSNRPR